VSAAAAAYLGRGLKFRETTVFSGIVLLRARWRRRWESLEIWIQNESDRPNDKA